MRSYRRARWAKRGASALDYFPAVDLNATEIETIKKHSSHKEHQMLMRLMNNNAPGFLSSLRKQTMQWLMDMEDNKARWKRPLSHAQYEALSNAIHDTWAPIRLRDNVPSHH
jgi:hypothetical protein